MYILQFPFFIRFGFIRFDDIDTATKALKQHNGITVDGQTIELRYAEDRGPPSGGRGPPSGGRGRGGRGGRQYFTIHRH